MNKSVLIVDDSKYLINQIRKFFENELKFHVIGVGYDGEEAVELYRKHRPDLLTLDLTMPNKDGQQAMSEILDEFPEANIVIISAVLGDSVMECMLHGARGYIEKPLKFADGEFVEDFRKTILELFAS